MKEDLPMACLYLFPCLFTQKTPISKEFLGFIFKGRKIHVHPFKRGKLGKNY